MFSAGSNRFFRWIDTQDRKNETAERLLKYPVDRPQVEAVCEVK
jgi:hypothetical protein